MEEENPIAEFLQKLKASPTGSLLDRVDELRARLIRVFILIGVFFSGCVFFAKDVFAWLKQPLVLAMPKAKSVLHFTGPMEVLTAYMKVSFLVAAVLAGPYLFLQLWRFIAPALPERTRKMVMPFFISSLLLFAGGVLFCYFFMMPAALEFLIGMGDGLAAALITVDDYISLVVFMLLGFGAVFELPLVVILLERLGIVQERMLTKNRGPILIAILVIAAILTPTPDPVSQLFMAGPMYILFEIAILIIKWMKRRDAVQASPGTP